MKRSGRGLASRCKSFPHAEGPLKLRSGLDVEVVSASNGWLVG